MNIILSKNENGECFINEQKIDLQTYQALQKLINIQNDTLGVLLKHNYQQYIQNNGIQCSSCGCYTANHKTINELLEKVVYNLVKELP